MKAKHIRLIPQNHTENLELSIADKKLQHLTLQVCCKLWRYQL